MSGFSIWLSEEGCPRRIRQKIGNGHEFEYTPGVGDGQGGLACCSLWGRRVGHN